jgi:hypothetical protein
MSDVVLVALIAALGSVVSACVGAATFIVSRNTHLLINSRMDELLTSARELARVEGKAEGEQVQREREET